MSICLIKLSFLISFGQFNGTDYHSNDLFKAVPIIDTSTPEWAQKMYADPYDFVGIHEAYKVFYQNTPFEKNLHTQNFKYWNRKVSAYVNDDGRVELLAPGVEFQTIERLKQNANRSKARMNTWTSMGPSVTYKNNGTLERRPTQANVYCIAVAPSNTNVIYAGMETGGVFKSIDKGISWNPISYDYAIGSPQEIKVDPLNENIVYVGRGKELFKSTDGGTTWNLIYTSSGTLEQFKIHSTQTNIIYCATADGILKSTDSGSSWTSLLTGRFYDIESKPGNDDVLYVAKENTAMIRPEIWKSTDAGMNWVLKDNQFYVPSDAANSTVYGCKIGVTPADPDRIYAGIIASGKKGDNGWIGVYHSLDEGDTWVNESGVDGATIFDAATNSWSYPSGSDANTNWYVAGYSSGYHQGFYNFDIDVSHNDADRIWIGTIWFCESGNKGGNVEYIRGTRSLEMHADIQDIDVVGNDIWVVSDGGINYSNDECQSVEVRMDGITASDFWGFGHGWNEDVWCGGRYHNGDASYYSNYGLGNTVFLGGAETATGYVNPLFNKRNYFSDIGDKKIPDSLNHPSQNIVNLGLYPDQSYFIFSYSEVEWHPNYANHVYVGKEKALHKSEDGGFTFNKISDLPGDIRRFEISRNDPNYIYAIVNISYWDWRVYKSVDGGLTFSQIATPPYSSGSWRNLSLTLNPNNKDEVWLASNSSNNGNKVFRSLDGGSTWSNMYSSVIMDQSPIDMIFQPYGSGGIVYMLSNNGFFYFNIDEGQWISYSEGLPVQHGGFKLLPFFAKNKLRFASNKGIWEAPMVVNSKPQAMPMVEQSFSYCVRDTVIFDSYSIAGIDGATWDWNITPQPSFVSDTAARRIKVVFGQPGIYDVELLVNQADGQSDFKSVASMIEIQQKCDAIEVPSLAMHSSSDSEYFVANEVNWDNLTHFTVTGWWKPDSLNAFGALFSSGDWCAHCDYTEALMIDYWGSRVWYKWPGAGSWGSNSGMNIPIDEWSYVALVIEPTKATMYLNEDKFEHNVSLNPGSITNFHIGRGHYNNSFWGTIDDVSVWSRALDENEIRLLRHLTKHDVSISGPDLLAYYQFNELIGGSQVLDNAGINHGTITTGAELVKSSAPIGGGTSESFVITAGGIYTSTQTGVELEFPNSGTYPNGEIVISRLNLQPNESPNKNPMSKSYWIINNYGTNSTFTSLTSIKFEDIGNMVPTNVAGEFYLHDRSDNEHLDNWEIESRASVLDSATMSITFNQNMSLDEFGQFVIENSKAKGWIGVISTEWDNPLNWGEGVVPGSDAHVVIPKDAPFQPIVNINTSIKSITIMEGASLGVLDGIQFEIKQ